MPIIVPIGNKIVSPCLSRGNKTRNYKIYIFLFTLVIYACYKIAMRSISVVKSVLHRNCTADFDIDDEQCNWEPFDGPNWSQLLGTIDLCYMLCYAVGQMLSGHICSRVHITYFLSAGMILTSITSSLFGLGYFFNIHSFYYYLFVQMFAGGMQGTGWSPVVSCMENWYGKKRRGFIMGVWNLHATVGNVLGSLIAGAFVETNWGLSFIVPAGICGICSIVVFFFLPPYPKDVDCKTSESEDQEEVSDDKLKSSISVKWERSNEKFPLIYEEKSEENNKPVSFLTALAIPGVIEFSCCMFFSKMVNYTFLFWLPNYILESDGVNPSTAATLSTMYDVGGIFGGIIAGYLSDVTGSSAILCTSMLILAIPTLFGYLYLGSTSLYASIVFLILTGIVIYGPNTLISTAVTADLGTHSSLAGNKKAVSMVSGIIDGTGSLGAAVGPILCGVLYPYGWDSVFYMLVVSIALAALLLSRRTFKDIKFILKR